MCGIVGIISQNPVANRLVDGLKRLEYRGYDSAGIATLAANDHIERRRAEGKLVNLENKLKTEPLAGNIGIGHTRWATHGGPIERNAHPHATDRVAVVHNGIIENYKELRGELETLGAKFQSDTDTEVIAHLMTHYLDQGDTPQEATKKSLTRLQGAFAIAMVFSNDNNLMIGARRGTPLALGYGKGEMFLASDSYALAPMTDTIAYLEDGDWLEINRDAVKIYDEHNKPVTRQIRQSAQSAALTGKGEYRHFMLKEIFEQPAVIADTLNRKNHRFRWRERTGQSVAFDDQCVRHGVLCRADLEILVRARGENAGRNRCRLRIPLSRSAPATGWRGDFHFTIR